MGADYPTTIAMKNLVLDVLSGMEENFHRDTLTGFEVAALEGQNPPCVVKFQFLHTDLAELGAIIMKFRANYPNLNDTMLYANNGTVIYELRFNRETLANQGKVVS